MPKGEKLKQMWDELKKDPAKLAAYKKKQFKLMAAGRAKKKAEREAAAVAAPVAQ